MSDLIEKQAAINSSAQSDIPDMNGGDTISRQEAINALCKAGCDSTYCGVSCPDVMAIESLPSAQPQYEELTPEEAASEIASGSIMSARYWLDAMIRLKQMGYAICKKR